jgi:WD40 repeat protein
MDQLIAQITGIEPSATFAWNPQSTHVATSYELGLGVVSLRIYDISDINTFKEYEIGSELGYIDDIDWSSNGQQIALKKSGVLYFLNLQTEQLRTSTVRVYADFESPRFVFSPDGRYLAGITEIDAISVSILDTSTDQIIGTLVGHTDRVLGINWIEGYIVTVGLDGITRLWNPVTFEQIRSLQTGVTGKPSFSPNRSTFVASSHDFQTILVRDSITGAIIASLDPIEPSPATVTISESDATTVTESGATDPTPSRSEHSRRRM